MTRKSFVISTLVLFVSIVCIVLLGRMLIARSLQKNLSALPVKEIELVFQALSWRLVSALSVHEIRGENLTDTQGVINEYRENPDRFKAEAALFLTWEKSAQILESYNGQRCFPKESASYKDPSFFRDSWGHQFCVFCDTDGRLIVYSAGPRASSEPNCSKLPSSLRQENTFELRHRSGLILIGK